MIVYTHLVLVCVVPRACRLFSCVYIRDDSKPKDICCLHGGLMDLKGKETCNCHTCLLRKFKKDSGL